MLGERGVRAEAVDGTDDAAASAPARPGRGPRTRSALRVLSASRSALTPPPGSVWRDPVTWTVATLVFGAYFAISLFRLLRLSPGSYDLGIYTEYVKQLSQLHAPIVDVLGSGFNLLGNHFQVAVAVIAPFFRLFPSPATLLFFQALATAVSVFPVVAAGKAFTGQSTGRLIGFAYGFSWGLQQMIDFDFHEIALAVPLLAFSVSALVRRRPAAVIAWAMPLVFVEESQGLTVAAIGLLLGATAGFPSLVSRLPALPGGGRAVDEDGLGNSGIALWGGLFLMAWGLFWSAFAIIVIIPHFNPLHEYYFLKDAGTVGGGRPFSVGALLSQAGSGWPTKGPTLALLLLPTAFAALGSPVALLALPSLALRFIPTNNLFWGTNFHYDATVMPILFIAAAEAIGRFRIVSALSWPLAAGRASPSGPGAAPGPAGLARDLFRAVRVGLARHGGAMMAAIAVALAFQFPLSGLWQSSTYQLDAHVAAADAAMAVVPTGATVQTNLDLLAPLAARTDTFWIGNAGNPVTRYIVFDGDNSGYSPAITDVPKFIAAQYPHDGYVEIFARDNVCVFRRP
ncbi:MAG: DUF2079 domain-containing protein [Trebonia sp.]